LSKVETALSIATEIEHVDVLVVGAGISGIGAAYHLKEQCPDKTYVVLDALETFGGTWWTHRYPGARSDSDLFTFGYRFKPWPGNPIASSQEILDYLGQVIEENDLAPRIRYNRRIVAASWSSDHRRWTLDVERTDTGEHLRFTAGFLWMCQGYYKHAEGYTPRWEGMDRFQGRIIHPQTWPSDLEYAGKRVVVIGSGATAATLIPAIADDVEHVTMLQRSPTFFVVRPNKNELADTLRSLDTPEEWTHEIVRLQVIQMQDLMTKMALEQPEMARTFLMESIKPLLPEGFDIDKHFNPRYRPWQQRLAVLPEGDMFKAIKAGKASVVTDEIESFTETGILLKSGETLEADIVITATGFDLSVFGDVAFTVDDEPVTFSDTVTYRGVMFTGVPNVAYVFGYFRASWTLRADLIADLVCNLLKHMDEAGATMVVPALRDEEIDMELGPWVDPENFNPGYLTRSLHLMPKQGAHDPWRLLHEYAVEKDLLPNADFEDGTLIFK
jgi:cation diffusion facilitator CzcD-associated flavoprotein CzcO